MRPPGAMHARSSSYHALGRATGHVRRASRTAAEFAAASAALSSGVPSPTGSASDATPSWLDFSPRADPGLPPARAAHKRAPRDRASAFPPPGPGPAAAVVLRHNKSAQRLYADARVAVKARTRALLPRRVLLAVAAMFFPVAFVLYHLLKRSYGMNGAPVTRSAPDAASNARRIEHGLPPLEYWPFRFRTRLKHNTPISKQVPLPDVLAVRTRHLKRSADYRVASRGDMPRSRFPVRVSVIASCKDRTGFLQAALPTWLSALSSYDEIVLVDWGTSTVNHVPLMAVVEALPDPRISLITLRKSSSWMLSRAYNLALSHARGEWILKVDCDTMLAPNLLHFHTLPPAPRSPSTTLTLQSLIPHIASNLSDPTRYYYRYSRDDAQHENDQYLSGVTLVHSDDLRAVYGYDERIVTYGWEDTDLYKRLERSVAENGRALTPKPFVEQTVEHVKHSHKFRLADQRLVSGPALQIEINRLALLSLASWTSETQERCTYSYQIASNDARYVFATTESTIRANINQLSTSMREEVMAEARTRLLHNEYGIPLDVLSEISRSRAELVRELDRLVREGSWAPGAGAIFAEVSGTAAQRLLGVASAVALASEYRRPLFLAWRPAHTRRKTKNMREPRVDDVLDLTGAAERGVNVFQMGAWRCTGAASECATADAAYSSMTEHAIDGDAQSARAILDLLQRRRQAPERRNIVLRLDHVFEHIPRDWLVSALRTVRPAPQLDRVLKARRSVLRVRQGVYLGPRLRAHNIDAFAQRLRADTATAGTEPAFFVAGADRALVRHARRALDAHLDMEAGGEHFDSATVEFGELYALALCPAMVNDGRTPRDVFDAVALLRDALYERGDG